MKKVISALAMVVLFVGLAQGQTLTRIGGSPTSDIFAITSWTGFSADSAATIYTNTFSLADYDTVMLWQKATSVNGSPNFRITLQGGFVGYAARSSNSDFDSLGLGAQADTTTVKLETLNYMGKSPTFGAPTGRLKLSPSTYATYGGTTYNRADSIIDLFVIGIKRQYAGPR